MIYKSKRLLQKIYVVKNFMTDNQENKINKKFLTTKHRNGQFFRFGWLSILFQKY